VPFHLLSRWSIGGAVLGVSAGLALWWAIAGSISQIDPQKWASRGSSVGLEFADLAGPLPDLPHTLDLWSYRGASPRMPPIHSGKLDIDVQLPRTGQLYIRLGAEGPIGGPNAPQNAGGLGGNTDEGPEGAKHPLPPERGVSVIIDAARKEIYGKRMTCDAMSAPTGKFQVGAAFGQGTVDISINGKTLGSCRGQWNPGDLALTSGVHRVRIHNLRLESPGQPVFEESFDTGLHSRLLAVLCSLLGGLAGAFLLRRRGLVLAAGPLLLCAPLCMLDLRGTLDTLRLLAIPAAAGALLLPGIPALFATAVVASKNLSWKACLAVSTLPAIGITLGCLLVDSLEISTWAALGLPFPAWMALSYVNTHPTKARVSLSYLFLALFLVLGEVSVRVSPVGFEWQRKDGWQRAAEEFRELLELKVYRSYPSRGFPVKPPEKGARPRIVALGSSSTGGAYQMDDLRQFWPARLQELMRDREVVNQAVGGWNSLHVRLYAESQLERLQPDLVLIYLGHNDLLSPSPVPYSSYYANYKPGNAAPIWAVEALNQSRLFNGLKFLVLAIANQNNVVAVDVEDARDNLRAIVRTAQGVGSRVLLMSEGLNPDPLPIYPYARMEEELAVETGERFLDTARFLHAQRNATLFLDDTHLSEEGHRVLATEIHRTLKQAGW